MKLFALIILGTMYSMALTFLMSYLLSKIFPPYGKKDLFKDVITSGVIYLIIILLMSVLHIVNIF